MLPSGTRLGPYLIVAPLGAGGMGEVYRARDTRLAREVAVKVLPRHLSRDPEVRARFEREARSISGLSHPHICVLHDVGREGDTDYLVMELVEGETLSKRIAKGALPLAEVLRLGSQVAEALARAHRAGVVHRDLKPGNIMVTKAGAKLMDFGLARSTRSATNAEQLTQASTESSPITGEGRVLGTVPYMAPEQLEGHEADARSDIWALGCVLYEMATGVRAFGGSSTASVMSAILRDEPAPLSDRAPASPPALERLIRSCLAKDAYERWQSAGDLALELGWLASGGDTAGAVVAARRGLGVWMVLAGLGVVALAAGLQLSGRAPWGGSPQRKAWTTLAISMPGFSARLGHGDYALSPDGNKVALILADSSGRGRLFVRSIATPALVSLVPDEAAAAPFWSPDSREVGFFSAEGKLMRVSALGGAPRTICKVGSSFGSASWGRLGWVVLGPSSGSEMPLMKVRADGGVPALATELDSSQGEKGHFSPEFLPDGRHFMFAVYPGVSPAHTNVRVGSLEGTRSHLLTNAQSVPQGDGRGQVVFMREHVLYSQRIDRRGDRLRGVPTPLDEVPTRWTLIHGAPVARVAGDRLLYAPADERPTDFVWYGRNGIRLERAARVNGRFLGGVLSPDGRRVVTRWPEGAEGTLWLLDLTTGSQRRLTRPDEWNSWPLWDASGERIAYGTQRAGVLQCRIMDPVAPESAQILLTGATAACFAPGNQQVVISGQATTEQDTDSADLMVHDMDPAIPDRGYATSPANELDCQIFDGGRHAAFTSDASGRWEVYCDAFPTRRRTVQLTYDGCRYSDVGTRSYWIVGNELLYVSAGANTLRSVKLERVGDGFAPGETRTLFDLPAGHVGIMPAPDGQRILVALPAGEYRARNLTFVDHWDAPPDRR